jgi:DNA-binding CsgD family transcriptional regulator
MNSDQEIDGHGVEKQPSRHRANSAGKACLTAAERRVITQVTLAKTNKEIAVTLGISPATVKRHLEKILTKLKLRNRVEAAIYGVLINGCPLQSRSRCGLRRARNNGLSATLGVPLGLDD